MHFEIKKPEFNKFIINNAPLKKIATGFDWVEGPVWFGDLNCLLFSDIPNNRIMRWIPNQGVQIFREPAHFSNGHTRDRNGRLISCEHGTRRVTRTEYDGSITIIADHYQGKRLNSPNDVVVTSDHAIWFTDPHYGISTNYEGYKSPQELPCNIYRVSPDGKMTAILSDFHGPNGLVFSPDEQLLYISDTGRMYHNDPAHIRVFTISCHSLAIESKIFHVTNPGPSDGLAMDSEGNLWASAADGVHCIAPNGTLLGKILVPEPVSNLCFGGRSNHQLFITATTSVYMIALNRTGTPSFCY